jgi:hypothetical protein
MEIHVGPPLYPPATATPAPLAEVRLWHATLMTEIANLSGKSWTERGERR